MHVVVLLVTEQSIVNYLEQSEQQEQFVKVREAFATKIYATFKFR